MKTLRDYARIDEAVDVSINGLKKLCANIKGKCKDLAGVGKCKKDIGNAVELAEELCDEFYHDDALRREAYQLLEDMIEHVWKNAVDDISNPERANAYWKDFSRTVGWLLPLVGKIYE